MLEIQPKGRIEKSHEETLIDSEGNEVKVTVIDKFIFDAISLVLKPDVERKNNGKV